MKPHESISINSRTTELQTSQFRPEDIAYILFRHKWKILFFSLSGIAIAAFLYVTNKPLYISQAKLFIRYVQESRALVPSEASDSIRSPDSRGDNILNSEVELITSLDLAQEVAEKVGATNILGADLPTDGSAEALAANAVKLGTEVEAPRKSNVLLLSFRHRNPATARIVLTNLVGSYLRMHARVHRALGALDDIQNRALERQTTLNEVERQLRELKDSLGISDLEQSKSSLVEQLNGVKQDLLATEALLAEAKAGLGYSLTNIVGTTNSPAATTSKPPEILRDQLAAYEGILSQIDALKKRQQELLIQFTKDSIFVINLRDRIASVELEKAQMEANNPGISTYASVTPRSGASGATDAVDRGAQISRVAGLEARWATLQRQQNELQSNLSRILAKEADLTELERKRGQYEKDYQYYSRAAEEARIDAALTSGRLANISVVQSASPAARDTEKLYKILAGVLAGGLAVGLGLALALEFYGDQSLRRPSQVARHLNIPVLLTIPRLSFPGKEFHAKALLGFAKNGKGKETQNSSSDGADAKPDAESNPLSAHAEALRDRIIMHFQLRELHHKPKLVGITSCGKDAGATTIATNLAASLSETGEGNVLYVDANPELGPSIRAFYRGKQATSVAGALDMGARESAKVNENFYVAALNENPIPGKVGVLPKKLANLLPKIKASDFDYIIFDLPPVTQTSATARVAGLLDMTLLVLESEKTHGDLAKQVTGLLKQSRADIAAVLNKHKRYVPQRLNSDL